MRKKNIAKLYQLFLEHQIVTTDSRKVTKNSIFFALKGDKFNGNKFAKAALENRAKYAVISDEKFYIPEKTILVDDTLKTLQELATYHRKKLKTKIIGITGSNGKTTTKNLINSVLATKYQVLATQGNFNNHIGVPITLLELKKKHKFAIIEMGANHNGEIHELCKMVNPNQGIITNIGKAHLGGFETFENIINTKLALFDAIVKNNGTFILNTCDKILVNNVKKYDKIVEYGCSENSITKIKKVENELLLKLNCEIKKLDYQINTKLIGNYNANNILSAITVGLINNIDIENIIDAIENYIPKNNRSQLLKTNKNKLILDMYNANPTSMKAAIENFKLLDLTNKCLIIGDMLELGENEQNEHQKIVDLIIESKIKKVFLVGKIFSKCENINKFIIFLNTKELVDYLKNNELDGLSILIKASNGIGLKESINYL